MENNQLDISIVIISLNEEKNIERLLRSVQWAKDIVVYDSGSQDQTVSIAKKMGAKVYEGPWMGFGATKKKATDVARFDWVLSLDCDEEVSDELRAELFKRFSSLDQDSVYLIPRLSFYLGAWIRHGGWYPDRQARLFNRKKSNWNLESVHEKVEAKSQDSFVAHLNHYVFKDIGHQVQTNNKYSTLQAEKMFREKKRFSWFHFFTKPSVKFFECYIWKLGFMDAWPGFVIARSAAYSVFLKWAKLRELEKGLKK